MVKELLVDELEELLIGGGVGEVDAGQDRIYHLCLRN